MTEPGSTSPDPALPGADGVGAVPVAAGHPGVPMTAAAASAPATPHGGSAAVVAPAAAPPLVPDLVTVAVPRGGRAVVVSDLHLSGEATEAATACTGEMVKVLREWAGPGVVVVAGDGFELLHAPVAPIEDILATHEEWARELAAFAAQPGHQLVVLAGNHDGQIAWDTHLVEVLRQRLGATIVALAVDLVLDTAAGAQKIRVVHGNQEDPYNAFIDPRSPIDTPAGHHVVRQVLPEVEQSYKPGGLLQGIEWLSEPMLAGEMVGSRLLYRRVVGRLWWLALPFLAAVLLRTIAFVPGIQTLLQANAQRWLVGLGIAVIAVVVVAVVVAMATMLRVHHDLSQTDLGHRSGTGSHNASARELAARLIAEGYAGLVSGHTHEPELSVVGFGFYANSGCGVSAVGPVPARFGLPRPFLAVRRCSRVELAAHEVVEVRLILGETPSGDPSRLERLVALRPPDRPRTPAEVAALPAGTTFPIDGQKLGVFTHRRRIRRWAAGLLVAAGVLNIVSTITGPSTSHLARIESDIPLRIPRAAGVLAVLMGVALIGLARAVRRGYRPAWAVVVVLLGVLAVVMFLKGEDIEEAVANAALALWLLAEHRHFKVTPTAGRRWAPWAFALALLGLGLAIVLAAFFGRDDRYGRAFTTLAVGVVVLVGWLVARPTRPRQTQTSRDADLDRARAIVGRCGGDTLDYFALRDDKELFFTGDGLVAYTVLDRTMLVSPDPICASEAREEVWADAMEHADANGWGISVLAANASWLPTYHAAGLQSLYIGDEAIVECQRFSLQGKAMKSLRGAHNRVGKAGYRVDVLDPDTAGAGLRQQLLALMTETRQGDAEPGFSMTLSRMFDPRDTGLLLAVCFDPSGQPVAFNQYVPAAAIGGYSLDVMRRTADPDAPNGLTDFVIIETIQWMKTNGYRGLGLNFATFRAVVSGEVEGGPWRRVQRRVLHHFSDTMQIESLWRFNQKYDPRWRPRYVVTDALLDEPRAGVAIARAESVGELPVVGRLLESHGPDPAVASHDVAPASPPSGS